MRYTSFINPQNVLSCSTGCCLGVLPYIIQLCLSFRIFNPLIIRCFFQSLYTEFGFAVYNLR
jgi:hypothetical protein